MVETKVAQAHFVGERTLRPVLGEPNFDTRTYFFRVFCPSVKCSGTTRLELTQRNPETKLLHCGSCGIPVTVEF